MYKGNMVNIRFEGGRRVERAEEIKYLGALINQDGDISRELRAKKAEVARTLNELQPCGRKCKCSKRWEMIVYNVAIRSKLIYGFESAQINIGDLKQLDI